MTYRIAINGLGRIGRSVLRAFYESRDYPDLAIVALNELADLKTLGHLTRFDGTQGRVPAKVAVEGEYLLSDGDRIPVSHIEALEALPWAEHRVGLVMECTGTFTSRRRAEIRRQRGAGKV